MSNIELGYEQLADLVRYWLDNPIVNKRFMVRLLKATNEEYDQQQREKKEKKKK